MQVGEIQATEVLHTFPNYIPAADQRFFVFFFFPKPHQSTHLEVKLFKAHKKYLVTFLLNVEFSLQAQGVQNNDLLRTTALAKK